MKKAGLAVWFAVVVLWPASGWAQSDILDWFDQLSGPGPFHNYGLGIDSNVWCLPKTTLNCYANDGLDLFSQTDSPNDSKWLVKLSASRSTTGSQQLFQDDKTDVRDVHQLSISPTVMYRANRIVEVGAGFSFIRLSSNEGAAFSFWRTGLIPARMSVTPLGLMPATTERGKAVRRLFQFQADAIWFPQSVSGLNFNNTTTKFSVGSEYRVRLALLVNAPAAWTVATGK